MTTLTAPMALINARAAPKGGLIRNNYLLALSHAHTDTEVAKNGPFNAAPHLQGVCILPASRGVCQRSRDEHQVRGAQIGILDRRVNLPFQKINDGPVHRTRAAG
jgi:hypothetical protein